MVKVHTVEMIEHSAHSTPNVKAHADLPNGALVGLTYTGASKVTKAPASGEELYIVLNTQVGDDEYALSYTIAQGEYVNLFRLSNWTGKELDITKENVIDTDADNLAVGNTLVFDAITFKFKKGTATTGDVGFTVTELLPIGARVLISIA